MKKIHGKTGTRLYAIRRSMMARCNNPNDKSYHRYGGRGITMCEAWLRSPLAFFTWAEEHGYEEHLTVERIDNNGSYSPENCRWATPTEQQRNTSKNRIICYKGECKSLAEWAELTGIRYETLASRLRSGWSIEKMLTKVPRSLTREISCEGIIHTLSKWAKVTGLSVFVISRRIDTLGWEVKRALTTPVRKRIS